MFARLRPLREDYPFQFWLLFSGMFISVLGMSMIWPFLMIYAKNKLALPMGQVASLMTVNALFALIFSFIAGPIIDKAGRKWTMVFSLFASSVGFLLFNFAETLQAFALVMAVRGAVAPLYQIGADAMLADLTTPEKRADAFALTRMSKNAAIALGPAIGGFLADISYTITFYLAAGGLAIFAILIAAMAIETRPDGEISRDTDRNPFAGYGQIFRDRPFMGLVIGFTLTSVCATLVWVLLGVYVTENFGMRESLYGFIPMTNALMVVFFQVLVTSRSKHQPPLRVMAAGSFLYALAVTSIAFGTNFWSFWLSMVILTTGELLLVPTATTVAANLAPIHMRGRYMGLYSLSWQVAAGIGPVMGGILNDQFAPQAIWYGGGVIGLIATLNFIRLALQNQRTPTEFVTD